MIPTIEDIVEGLILKLYTREQAIAWLRSHVSVAVDAMEASDMRDSFAASAMTGLLAKTFADGEDWHTRSTHACSSTALIAYALADAMLRERAKPPC